MINKKKILAIIAARQGSSDLKNKNLRLFNKKPLITWTLKAACKSKYIDEVVVTSDSKKILNIAKKYKVILSKRPKRLATKNSDIIDTVLYEINRSKNIDIVILLQPTSPLRKFKDIDQSLKLMMRKSTHSCVSLIKLKYHPQLYFRINENGKLVQIIKRKLPSTNRQSFADFYYQSGDIYISYVNRIKKKRNFVDRSTTPFIIERENYSDIDNIFDFKTAEFHSKIKKK